MANVHLKLPLPWDLPDPFVTYLRPRVQTFLLVRPSATAALIWVHLLLHQFRQIKVLVISLSTFDPSNTTNLDVILTLLNDRLNARGRLVAVVLGVENWEWIDANGEMLTWREGPWTI